MNYIVVVPCHFERRDELCETTRRRLEAAMDVWRKDQSQETTRFIVTGNVPYEPGTKTLARLMQEWLQQKGGIKEDKISIGRGVGIFSEARENMTQTMCPDAEVITLVGSEWYFWPARPVWLYYARKQKLLRRKHDQPQIHGRRVVGTGGLRVRFIYAGYWLIVRAAFIFGLQEVLGWALTMVQSGRIQGFKTKGC